MGRQVQRSAYLPTDLDAEVEQFIGDSDDFDGFSELVRYSIRETMQKEEYNNE